MTVDIVVSLKMLALLGAIVQPIKLSSGQFAEVLNTSVQTAARRLQELDNEGLVHRRIIVNGQWVILTERGIARLKSECYEYQKIFFSTQNTEIEIGGRLITGLGEGQYYTTLSQYKRQFTTKLGFTPFPGTLNLRLDSQSIEARKKLEVSSGIEIEGFVSADRTFGGGKCFPCKILRNNAEGIKSAVVIPDRTHYPENVLEIISPIYLRCELKLIDGDEIKTKVMI